jgi:hypothetical protein
MAEGALILVGGVLMHEIMPVNYRSARLWPFLIPMDVLLDDTKQSPVWDHHGRVELLALDVRRLSVSGSKVPFDRLRS